MRALIAIVTLWLLVAPALADEPIAENEAVRTAESLGHALYAADNSAAIQEKSTVAAARARISDWCQLKYHPVIVTGTDGPLVYFLGAPPKHGDIVFGRHYLVAGSTVMPSTKSCLVMSPTNAAQLIVTHLLSDTPTEFHVYLSLVQERPIYVMTKQAVWVVEKGKVRLLETRPGT